MILRFESKRTRFLTDKEKRLKESAVSRCRSAERFSSAWNSENSCFSFNEKSTYCPRVVPIDDCLTLSASRWLECGTCPRDLSGKDVFCLSYCCVLKQLT